MGLLLPMLVFPAVKQLSNSGKSRAELWQQAKTAESQDEQELALGRYAESQKLAQNPSERLASIEACHRIFRKQGKNQAAGQLLRDSLDNEDF